MANLESLGARRSSRFIEMIEADKKEKQIRQFRETLITMGIVFAFLLFWEISSRLELISKIIFPAPTFIISTLAIDLIHGVYYKDISITLSRLLSGMLVGGSAGLLLGLLMGWSPTLRRIIDPIVALLHPIPKMTLLPMVLIIFGLGESSRVVMVSISAFFPLLLNTMIGVRQINPIYYDVLTNYGASKLDIFRKVVLPGSMPYILSGIRLSFQTALTTSIGIEMIFGNNGLGSALWLSWETMRLHNVYSIIIMIAVLGAGTTLILELIKVRLMPWHHENRGN